MSFCLTGPVLEYVWSCVGLGSLLRAPHLNLSDCSSGGDSVTDPVMESVTSIGGWGVSFINPVLTSAWSFVGWGVSLIRPVLESVSSFVGWGVSLTCPVLESVSPIGSLGVCLTCPVKEFVRPKGGGSHLEAPCWSLSGRSVCWDVSVTRRGSSLSYTPFAENAPCWNLSGYS